MIFPSCSKREEIIQRERKKNMVPLDPLIKARSFVDGLGERNNEERKRERGREKKNEGERRETEPYCLTDHHFLLSTFVHFVTITIICGSSFSSLFLLFFSLSLSLFNILSILSSPVFFLHSFLSKVWFFSMMTCSVFDRFLVTFFPHLNSS